MRFWILLVALWFSCSAVLANDVIEDYGSDNLTITVSAGNAKVAHNGQIDTLSTLSGMDILSITTAGSITVSNAVTIKSTGVMTLRAGHGINVNAALTANGGINLISAFEPVSGTSTVNTTGPLFIFCYNQDALIGASGSNAILKSGPSNVATVTGTPTAGETVSITVTDVGIDDGSETVAYPVFAGDTNSSIATVLSNSINNNPRLAAGNVSARVVGGAITILAPSSATFSRANSANTTITFAPATLTISNYASTSQTVLVAGTIATTSAMTFGSTAPINFTSGGALNIANTLIANGGITLSSGTAVIGGAGSIDSTGPIALHFVEPTAAVSLGTSSGKVTTICNSTQLTINTSPTSITGLGIDSANSVATTNNIDIGAGVLILQAASTLTYNNNLTAATIYLNCAGTKSGTGTLTGTVVNYP